MDFVGWSVQFLLLSSSLISVCNASPFSTSGNAAALMPSVTFLDAECSENGMTITIDFNTKFNGVIYSKGHYYEKECSYVDFKNNGKSSYSFFISSTSCGTHGRLSAPTPDEDMFFQNTIIIQNDPIIQEVWDQARELRCVWQHSFTKTVKPDGPLIVADNNKVSVELDSGSINTILEVQSNRIERGRARALLPSPPLGYIHVGEETSVVLYVQDDGHKTDANVVSCTVSDASGQNIRLVDSHGCVLRQDLLIPFIKIRGHPDVHDDLMLYSRLNASILTNWPQFIIRCQLELCEGTCLPPCAMGPSSDVSRDPTLGSLVSVSRIKRQALLTKSANTPSAVVQLQKGVLFVKDEVPDCGLSRSVAFSVTILVACVATLSMGILVLSLKLKSLNRRILSLKSGSLDK